MLDCTSRIVGVCHRHAVKTDNFPQHHSSKCYTDYAELLYNVDVKALFRFTYLCHVFTF